jgi:hypothetical protein
VTDQTASSPTRRVGALIAGAYLVAVVATLTLSGHRVLPLFEGVGPPRAYQWVHPPPQFSAGNVTPQPSATDIPFTGGKTGPAGAATSDGQFLVNFSAGAFAPHDADTAVHAAIAPLDPATLGPVPLGLAADGNAYRIQLTYRPSNTPVGTLAGTADVIVAAPQPAQVLLYSADGQAWTKLPTQTISGQSTVGSTFTRPGWFLVGASPTAVSGQHNGGLSTVVIAALVAGLAIVLAATPAGLRAIRGLRPRRKGRLGGAPPRPGGRPARPSKRSRR